LRTHPVSNGMKIFYFLTLAIVIVMLIAAVAYSEFYHSNESGEISISKVVTFSGALQWVITGGYFLTFIGMFMFGPIIISAAAFAAALGYFDIWVIFGIAVFGELAVDLLLYAIGYFSRLAIVERYGSKFGLSGERLEKLEKLIKSHPGKTLTAIKLAPILPVPGLMVIGSTHMSLKNFTLINFAIALVRAAVFIIIGYYFGQVYDSMSRYLKNAEYVVLAGIIVVAAIFYAYKKATEKISKKLEKI